MGLLKRIVEEKIMLHKKRKKLLNGNLEQRERSQFLERAQGKDKRWRKIQRKKNSENCIHHTRRREFSYRILSTISTKFLLWIGKDFDRHDVEELYRLVKERYRASRPKGYDLMLWGDLHTMFEPNEDDELWQNQHQYNLLR
ncbi:hypothetical protein Tco_0882259 [Tanacetum coccineum]